MAEIIFLSALILLIFIIQSISLRIIYENEVIISIYFLFFRLILYPQRRKKAQRQKNRNKNSKKNKFKKLFKSIRPITKASIYMLSHSKVTLHSLNIKTKNKEPDKTVLTVQNLDSLINSALAFIKSNARELIILDEEHVTIQDIDEPKIDISFDFSLFNLILSIFIFLKAKAEGRTANVRN